MITIKERLTPMLAWMKENAQQIILGLAMSALLVTIVYLSYVNRQLNQENSILSAKVYDMKTEINELHSQDSAIATSLTQRFEETEKQYTNLRQAVIKIDNTVSVDRERIVTIMGTLGMKVNGKYNEENVGVESPIASDPAPVISDKLNGDLKWESETPSCPPPPKLGWKKILPWHWF